MQPLKLALFTLSCHCLHNMVIDINAILERIFNLITTNPQPNRLRRSCFVLIIWASAAWTAAAEPPGMGLWRPI
ncbi:hypothetical protein UWK_00867 [Desulfocapsa sulfexigens DSM 10523]|uniref:Uncharacterized protein n=1 Tax=Desulfocapsa sulfexigens (strain DSM 10523 / SB164P1) TaxID=1167006 RepID=M1PLW7_DESSD|nr:hypothetical protein UWK_00867 [Desulfocapsa sulfexigens DSM 10523]